MVCATIGGIFLYKSYAYYEEDKEYNVIKGIIPDFSYDVKFAFTVDGTKTEKLPTDKNYVVDVTCDNNVKAEWNYETWSPVISDVVNATKCNINYLSPNKIDTLAKKLGVTATNIDGIITNIDSLVKNKEGMIYLSKSPTLVSQLKSNSSYNDTIKEKILNSSVITEKEKYDAGLPCYLLKSGTATGVAGNLINATTFQDNVESQYPNKFYKTSNGYYYMEISGASSFEIISFEKALDLSKYTTETLYFKGNVGHEQISATMQFGLSNSILNSNFTKSQSTTLKSKTQEEKNISVSNDNSSTSYYIKLKYLHNTELTGYTIYANLEHITLR